MIIDKLNNIKIEVSKDELEQCIDELFVFFQKKVYDTYCSSHAVGMRNNLAKKSFDENVRIQMLNALVRYFVDKKYQFTDRNIHPYLITVIDHLGTKLYWDLNITAKRSAKLTCPACKFFGYKSFLSKIDGKFKCLVCEESIIADEQSLDNDINIFNIKPKILLRKAFLNHSRLGYSCLDCKRFIPDSLSNGGKIFCPYLDCCFVADVKSLKKMAQTRALEVQSKVLSFDQDSASSKRNKIIDELKCSSMTANYNLEVNQEFEIEENINLLKNIINKIYKKASTEKMSNIQRRQMCKAYLDVLQNYPQEMVSYLIYRSHSYGIPIQSFIFHEYVKNIKNIIPFTYLKNNEEKTITHVLDNDLNLFWGLSEFETEVNKKNIIPNKTKEVYIGGNDMKNYGPCYFGEILNITDMATNLSIVDQVDHSTFSKIVMKSNILPGTRVKVGHYRIPSHYELGSLVMLQRIRKIIVDTIKKENT